MCSTPVTGGGIRLLVVQTSGKASTRCWMSLGMAERTTLLRTTWRENQGKPCRRCGEHKLPMDPLSS